jgi:hypothetical protein
MMTTPRVTEIPIAMVPVEPDSFIDVIPCPSVVQRRVTERETHERRMELVRRTMRMRGRNWSDAWAR